MTTKSPLQDHRKDEKILLASAKDRLLSQYLSDHMKLIQKRECFQEYRENSLFIELSKNNEDLLLHELNENSADITLGKEKSFLVGKSPTHIEARKKDITLRTPLKSIKRTDPIIKEFTFNNRRDSPRFGQSQSVSANKKLTVLRIKKNNSFGIYNKGKRSSTIFTTPATTERLGFSESTFFSHRSIIQKHNTDYLKDDQKGQQRKIQTNEISTDDLEEDDSRIFSSIIQSLSPIPSKKQQPIQARSPSLLDVTQSFERLHHSPDTSVQKEKPLQNGVEDDLISKIDHLFDQNDLNANQNLSECSSLSLIDRIENEIQFASPWNAREITTLFTQESNQSVISEKLLNGILFP